MIKCLIEDSRNEFNKVLNDSLEKEVIAFLTKNAGNIYIEIVNDGKIIEVNDDIDTLQ